jgi:hypothetical protein
MDLISSILILLPTVVGGFSAMWGIRVYRKEHDLKRKDALFPLLEELHESKDMKPARLILDENVIRFEREWNKPLHSLNIIWENIHGDYRPLKDLMKEEVGLDWIENQNFVIDEEKATVKICDNDHSLSIIRSEKLPYQVDVKTLDKMIGLEHNKENHRYVYYYYAGIIDGKISKLGYYYHKSGLKYILRKHPDNPIMENDEDQVRKSFDSLFRFWERIGYLDKDRYKEVQGQSKMIRPKMGLGLFEDKELNFFLVNMKKLLDDKAIKEYVEYYGFRLVL